MSSDSESGDQFFDAEDNTPIKTVRSKTKSAVGVLANQLQSSSTKHNAESPPGLPKITSQFSWDNDPPMQLPETTEQERKEIERKVQENERRRRKLEEMRRKVQSDECDSFDAHSQTSSPLSSLDSMYLNQLSRLQTVEGEDAQSMVSLGKVGKILSGSENVSLQDQTLIGPSVSNSENEPLVRPLSVEMSTLQEPDVVASTKTSSLERPKELMGPPVAPPRKKRKNKRVNSTQSLPRPESQHKDESHGAKPEDIVDFPNIPSPASTVETLTKEFEHSLDIRSAVKGDYVVKPQDEEMFKAEGPPCDTNESQLSPMLNCDSQMEALLHDAHNNMGVRTRTDSGKQLSDLEILEQVMVLNLDTGEQIPLSLAEDRLPQCINPLSLHIMRLTSEYVSNSSLENEKESDEDTEDKRASRLSDQLDADGVPVRKQRKGLKTILNKTVNRIKSGMESYHHSRHSEDTVDSSEDEPIGDTRHSIKFKSGSSHKGPYEFDNLKLLQDLMGHHSGAVWTMKFSYCGRLLATAGQDHILRVWVLKDAYDYFNNMRQKYNAESKISPTPSQESLLSTDDGEGASSTQDPEANKSVFMVKPFFTYSGHTADLLDVSWSKNYFILSSSMDKTVRLWHISRKECLCCFQHIDFVTAIAFHPRDDRYFLSGSLDGKLRLWNIPDKKVALWNELDGQTKLITSASFCQNGKFAVVGSYDGRCVFYNTEQLKYFTQIHVRSTRGRNAKGRKISGIEPMPGEDKILVTSNDSRIRLYDLRDLSLSCKYKGYTNLSSQIRASFSHDGKFIISGSENQYVYMWKTHHDYAKFSSARRDRNDYWEGVKAHNAVVTAAVFAPNPALIFAQLDKARAEDAEGTSHPAASGTTGYVLVTADFNGGIKVFANKTKTKASTT